MLTKRNPTIDWIRAIAIIMMVCYHLSYDLVWLKIIKMEVIGHYWTIFPRIIVTLFLFCVGLTLTERYSKGIEFRHFFKRELLLLLASLLVTISTFILFRDRFIYFGVLHCILVSSLLALPFLKKRALPLILAALIFTLNYFNVDKMIFGDPKLSTDYIPLIPWFAVVLIGISIGNQNWFQKISKKIHSPPTIFSFISSHSLIIYLLHQPLLYGVLFLVKQL